MLKGKSILIVDDEEMLREILIDVFRSEGATVSEAANGSLALDIVQNGNFDAVITDVRMPGGNGVDLIKKMNEFFKGIKKPLVFLCSGFNDVSQKDLNDLGITGAFIKPYSPEQLMKNVDSHLAEVVKKAI